IRTNQADFSGVESEHGHRDNEGPRVVELLKPIIESVPTVEQKAIKSILITLFPRLSRAYGSSSYGPDWLPRWASEKRICSPDYCPRYFSYTVPKSDVRDSEMDKLFSIAVAGLAHEVDEDIVAHFTGGKAKRVIERMRQMTETAPPEAVDALCLAIAKNAKSIPNLPSLFSFAEPVGQAGILISQLISRLPAGDQRVEMAKQVIDAADPLWFGSEILRWLYVTDDEDKAENNALTKEEVETVRRALVDRIKASSAAGDLLFNVDVSQEQSMLFDWWRAEGREPVQAHLESVFAQDPQNIALFLQTMAPSRWGDGDVIPRVGDIDGNQLKSIELIYDLDELAKLIRQHLPGDFENPQWFPDNSIPVAQRLAQQFIFVHRKWNEEEGTTDSQSDSGGPSLPDGTDGGR
ncbi:MAG: hypothetical protein AB8F26_12520, partial [Phycisphaerales bacterium]